MNCPICLDRRLDLRVASIVLAVLLSCGDDDSKSADAGADADAGGDSSVAADGGGDAGSSDFFGPCESDADCPDGTFCDTEISGELTLSGLPVGMRVDQSLFPGGSCSPKPLVPFDNVAACDSSLPQAVQGCGKDGACVLETIQDQTYAACRPACEPSAADSGCERAGYTCDFGLKACIEGCRSEAECRIRLLDGNGDGVFDGLGYDTTSEATCDPATARCTHPGSASVPVGTACERIDDCQSDGQCLQGSAIAGLSFPGGYCTTVGCEVDGRECNGDALCEPLRPWLGGGSSAPFCLTSCVVGAEPAELRLGNDGHGQGCREGYRCHYNGGEGADDGVCVGGVYNDVTENNIGAACASDGECYSPYGLALCLQYAATSAGIRGPTGVCTLFDCNAPGIPDDICGPRAECTAFSRDLTFCIQNCADPAECAEGYACTDEDGDPGTARVCFPACSDDSDCTSGNCAIARGADFGQCVAS